MNEIKEFSIDKSNGKIYVADNQLDYEQVRSHQFTVEIMDENSHRVECAVKIEVLDENDNSPIFDNPYGKLIVPKELDNSCPGIFLSATDMDSGENGAGEPPINLRQIWHQTEAQRPDSGQI